MVEGRERHRTKACCSTWPEPLDYVVEAAGVRSAVAQAERRSKSRTRRRSISNTPIPSYTGLEPRKIEDGGDIAVLEGHRRRS